MKPWKVDVSGLLNPEAWGALSDDGSTVVGLDGILDLGTGVCRSLKVPNADGCIAVSSSGRVLVLQCEFEPERHWVPRWVSNWFPNARRRQKDPWSGDAVIYDRDAGRTVGKLSRVGAVAFSPDGRLLAVGGHQTLQLWELGPPAPWFRILAGAVLAAWLAWRVPCWIAWLRRRVACPGRRARPGIEAPEPVISSRAPPCDG